MKPRMQVALLIGLPVLLIGIAIWVAASVTGPSDLEKAEEACDYEIAPEILTVGDDGDSLAVRKSGSPENATDVAMCVLDELEVPDSIVAKIEDTSANQGRQEDDWDSYRISWTFHPDDGIGLIVESR